MEISDPNGDGNEQGDDAGALRSACTHKNESKENPDGSTELLDLDETLTFLEDTRCPEKLSVKGSRLPRMGRFPPARSPKLLLWPVDEYLTQQRRLLMEELIETERKYIGHLEWVVENYMPAMDQLEKLPRNMVGKKKIMFSNLPRLLEFNRQRILPQLEQYRRCPINIGVIFIKEEEGFLIYSKYFMNMPRQSKLMEEGGIEFFRDVQERLEDYDLSSYFIKPFQRVTKYKLFLSDMIKHLSITERKGRLKECFDQLSEAVKIVDFLMRHGNDLLAVEKLKGFDGDIHEQGKILRQGDLVVFERYRKQKRRVFLFENTVILTKTKEQLHELEVFEFRNAYKTSDFTLNENVRGHPTRFELLGEKESLMFEAEVEAEKTVWTRDIWDLLFMSQKEAQAIVDKALQSGSLKQRNLITVVTGIMGAGKTCFLCQLFGLKPPSKYTSTGVAEKSRRGLMHHVAKMGSFQLLSNDEVHQYLAPFLSAGISEDDTATLDTVEELVGFRKRANEFNPASETSTSRHFSSKIENDSPVQSQPNPTELSVATLKSDSKTVPDKSFSSEAMSIAIQSKVTSKDPLLQLLHVIDTGGQPEFMEVMPCLIHNANLTALVLNVAQKLDAYPKITFHRKGKGFARVIPFPMTNRQIIENLARTMQAKKCVLGDGESSKLIVIFTHCDCIWPPWKRASTIADVNRELKKFFIPAFQKELRTYRSEDEIGFPVNCRSPGTKDQSIFQQIRENISKVNVGKEIEIPPSFLMFEHDVIRYAEQLGREVLSFTECRQVGVHLKMSEKVVQAALIYFHQHNIFLYFPKILPKLVFTDPQVPLDFVNKVVAFSYLVHSGEFAGLPPEYSISLKNGVLLEEMLNEEPLSSSFVSGIYESEQAIALFSHLRVIALIKSDKHKPSSPDGNATPVQKDCSGKQRYLMPCMLPIEENIRRFLPQSPVAEFVVRFKDDCVPNGVFGGSVATLLSVYGWNICHKEDGSPQCMKHDIVTLHDPLMPAQITYLNATRHCEIHVNARDFETCVDISPTIRSTIFSAIEATLSVMHFDSTIENAFICPCELKLSLAHAAVPCTFSGKVHLSCSISGEHLGIAEEKHRVWLTPAHQAGFPKVEQTARSVGMAPSVGLPTLGSTAPPPVGIPTSASTSTAPPFGLSTSDAPPVGLPTSVSTAPIAPPVGQSTSASTAPPVDLPTSTSTAPPVGLSTSASTAPPVGIEPSQKKKERLLSMEDRPTLPHLLDFRTKSGSINVIQQVGTHYTDLGVLLLQDDSGEITQAFKKQYHHDAYDINREILQQWIQGKGKMPVQWSTLIEVLKKIRHSVLAYTLEENLQ